MSVHKYTVHALDVWGNAEGGYDVNDVYPSQGKVEIADEATEADIIAALQAQGFVRADIDIALVEVHGDWYEPNGCIYLDYDGRPEMELRKVEE